MTSSRQAISTKRARSQFSRPITRLPLLEALYGLEWSEKIQRTAFAPKGKKREREAELRAYVTEQLGKGRAA